MAGSIISVFSDLLKKLENGDQELHVVRTLAMANIPAEAAKELKMVEKLTPLLTRKDLKGPVTVVLEKLGMKKKESRKRKAVDATKDSKAPAKKKKSEKEEPKENVAPKKTVAPPKKKQPTALMRKCMKQARGMQIWQK